MLSSRVGVVATFVLVSISACGGGGGGGSSGPADPLVVDPDASEFTVEPAFGTPADGTSEAMLELRLVSATGAPVPGATVELEVSGSGHELAAIPPTDAAGRTRAALTSLAGERKTVRARVESGGVTTELDPRTVEFLRIPANTFFVRRTGSDARSGRSPRDAWGTLAHALANAGEGATVHVGAGIHSGPLVLARDASATTPFVLAGDRDGRWTGDPGAAVIAANGFAHALALRGARNVVVQGLTLRGATVGLDLRDSRDVRVLACELYENTYGLALDACADVLVQDCRISANTVAGARLAATQGLRFENNLVYANRRAGLLFLADVGDALVRYNTFHRNAGPHLAEIAAAASGVVEGNLLTEGTGDPLVLGAGSGLLAGLNLAWANTGASTPPGEVIAGDPLFVDPSGPDGILGGSGGADDDFRVAAGSPALDAATQLATAVVLGSHESLGTRTSRADGERDGSGSDLPAANLGYHAPLPLPECESVAPGGAGLVHARPGDVRAHGVEWSDASPNATRARSSPWLDAEVLFVEQRLSPLATREELLVAQVSTGASGRILTRCWDGRLWSEPAHGPHVADIPLAEVGEPRFDVEYGASGRALLAWGDGDAVPSFAVLENGRWTPARDVAPVAAGAGRVLTLELVPRPGTDELALLTLDDERDLVVTLWDGTEFGTPRLLETDTLHQPTWRSFDAAYESLSGDLLVSWGFSRFVEETRWAERARATGEWRTGLHASTDALGVEIALAADPTTDRIAALFGEGDIEQDLTVSLWTGTDWTHTAELTLGARRANRLAEIAWVGRSGLACAFFRREGHAGSFNVAVLLQPGWRIQPDVVLAGPAGSVDQAVRMRWESLPGEDALLGLVLDRTGKLFAVRHAAGGFTVLDGGTPLASALDPDGPVRPFDLALAPPPSAALR